MEGGRRQIELMNALLMSMPGTPIIYYGDEIGMGDNIYLGDRNGVRTPMQWSADRNAGFSEADTAALFSPLIVDPPYGYHTVNVVAQESSRRRCCAGCGGSSSVRQQYKAFGRGTWEPLDAANRRVLVFLRRYKDETILCVNNLSRFAQFVELDLREFDGLRSARAVEQERVSRRSATCRICSRSGRTTSCGSGFCRRSRRRNSSGRRDDRSSATLSHARRSIGASIGRASPLSHAAALVRRERNVAHARRASPS